MDILESELAEMLEAERERNCAAVCVWCKQGCETFRANDGTWWHYIVEPFSSKRCTAAAIRASDGEAG